MLPGQQRRIVTPGKNEKFYLAGALDVRLHFLPPYCPDANRIERVWQDLHANVTRNHRCKTMKALLGRARDYLQRYVWRRVTGAAPIIQMAADQGVAWCRSRIVAGDLATAQGLRGRECDGPDPLARTGQRR
jgi:hypothetical protein